MSEHLPHHRAKAIAEIRDRLRVSQREGVDREMCEIILLDIAPEAKYAALVTAMVADLYSDLPPGLALARSGLFDGLLPRQSVRPNSKKERKHLTPYRRENVPFQVRRQVYERDGNKCLKCGSRRRLSLDHVIPVTSGGDNSPENLQTFCLKCNLVKSANMEMPEC